MKEHPILFSGPMVRALLAGNKTQTRRVVKPQPTTRLIHDCGEGEAWFYSASSGVTCETGHHEQENREVRVCPYGQPGDRLWVRETFNQHDDWLYFYKADEIPSQCLIQCWTPSIHMPRIASRITLEITDIRVERVQEITNQDAKSEGLEFAMPHRHSERVGIERPERPDPYPAKHGTGINDCWICASVFENTWNLINAKRGYGWDVNPWVWVVEFKRIIP